MRNVIQCVVWMLAIGSIAGQAQAQQAQAQQGEASFWASDFSKLDGNKDGRVDAEEFLAEKKKEWAKYANAAGLMPLDSCLRSSMDRMAAAGASEFNPAWIKQAQGACSKLDRKKDGALTWEEFAGPRWAYFKLLDVNHHGYLSAQEFADGGVAALRLAPKPAPMTASQQARVDRDLQRVRTQHRAPRTAEQVRAGAATSDPARGAGPELQYSAPAALGAAAADEQRSQGVGERIMNWLR